MSAFRRNASQPTRIKENYISVCKVGEELRIIEGSTPDHGVWSDSPIGRWPGPLGSSLGHNIPLVELTKFWVVFRGFIIPRCKGYLEMVGDYSRWAVKCAYIAARFDRNPVELKKLGQGRCSGSAACLSTEWVEQLSLLGNNDKRPIKWNNFPDSRKHGIKGSSQASRQGYAWYIQSLLQYLSEKSAWSLSHEAPSPKQIQVLWRGLCRLSSLKVVAHVLCTFTSEADRALKPSIETDHEDNVGLLRASTKRKSGYQPGNGSIVYERI